MGIYRRGAALWLRYQDAEGTWKSASSGFRVGDEGAAQAMLAELEARIASQRPAALAAKASRGHSKRLRNFAQRWLAARDTATKDDDRGRIENYILPKLGELTLAELRPRHIRDFVAGLNGTRKIGVRRGDGTVAAGDELLAPRTVHHIYATLRAMLNDAVADELIPSNPCVLKDELPAKRDKDMTWRRTAVFSREEVVAILSAGPELVPDDRRVMYALMFLGAMRFGEAAALTWRDYEPEKRPLGCLVVQKSYSTHARTVKGTKTENPREMPAHPTLARILAEWKLGGFARLTGRTPTADDLVVPSRQGQPRNANHMLRRFHQDLERLGLRPRRMHDARRTFISLAIADGAHRDRLEWVTHGPRGDVMSAYTTLPWATLCQEVAKVSLSLREGGPAGEATNAPDGASRLVTPSVTAGEVPVTTGVKWRSGRDSKATEIVNQDTPRHATSGAPSLAIVTEHHSVTAARRTPLQDSVAAGLTAALAGWEATRDRRALRRALLAVLADADDDEPSELTHANGPR